MEYAGDCRGLVASSRCFVVSLPCMVIYFPSETQGLGISECTFAKPTTPPPNPSFLVCVSRHSLCLLLASSRHQFTTVEGSNLSKISQMTNFKFAADFFISCGVGYFLRLNCESREKLRVVEMFLPQCSEHGYLGNVEIVSRTFRGP